MVAILQTESEPLKTEKVMKQTIPLFIGLALAGAALTTHAQQGRGWGMGAQHRYGAQKFPPPARHCGGISPQPWRARGHRASGR